MITDNPVTSHLLADFAQTLTSQERVILMELVGNDADLTQYPDEWQAIIRGDFKKHGNHDQKTHGYWANGRAKEEIPKDVIADIMQFTREWGGLSISMVDGHMPDKGFMVAKPPEFSHVVDEADFFDPIKGPKILSAYLKKNRADLGHGGKDYLGTWLNGGKIYLDVSQNIMGRDEAIRLGRERNQKAIWDVVNQVEIDTGGTGDVKKGNQSSTTSRHFKDDGRGDRCLCSEDLGEVSKAKVIRFAPGLKPTFKHLEGQHDQKRHGRWAEAGYTEEEEARISEMSSMGPALEDLDAILASPNAQGSNPGIDDFRLIVENDQGMYEAATDGLDERVKEKLERLQEEFPNHEYTEQEKSTIYEDTQREMVDEYIDQNSDDLHAEYQASLGGDEDTETLLGQATAFFEDVYNTQHEIKNSDGEVIGYLESRIDDYGASIADHPYNGAESAISFSGVIADQDGNFAGEFQRTFWKDKEGNWNVEHDLFKMEDDYQGLGFGKDFIQRQEDWYTAAGFKTVEVGTAWDGARHWARAGYDFNERYTDQNMTTLVSALNTVSEYSDDFKVGSPERIEFDSLMSRATQGYESNDEGVSYGSVRSITSNDFPIPNDFAMIGYDKKTSYTYIHPITGEEKTAYTWAGQRLLEDLNLKYKKGITAEGRSIIAGPIDRDGDGLVYDGTAREKPASAVNS